MDDEHQGSALIVEDEAELRFILTAHLRATGFTVVEASNGVEAIELATERRPDIIIMDIGLPAMDGITATRTLKADSRTAHIPIIMLTARTGTGDVVRGLEAGAQEYLTKPFDVAELLARVRSVHRLTIARRELDRLNTRLEAEVDNKTKTLRRLYEFMRDLNHADSRDRILDLLIRCVEHTTGAQRISLFLMDATGEYLICERALGIDRSLLDRIPIAEIKGVTEQVVRTGTTLAAKIYGTTSRPARGYRQAMFLSTPLLDTSLEKHDSVIGVLNVTDKTDDSPFSEGEIDCIRSITDATAIALDRFNRRIRLQQSVRVLLHTLGHMAEFRDPETTLHLERVTRMSRILAEAVGREGPYVPLVTTEFIEMLVQAAPMHDIGKVGIADDILIKPGSLTDEEFQIMKTHTDIGRRVLSGALDPSCPVPLLTMCIDIAHCHHERFDGSGYPRRLVGQDIPLSARIIALVDAYDAITSRRRYKEPKLHSDAVEIIRTESGKHFDPAMVDAFLQCHEQFQQAHEECEDTLATPSGSNRTECIVTAG